MCQICNKWLKKVYNLIIFIHFSFKKDTNYQFFLSNSRINSRIMLRTTTKRKARVPIAAVKKMKTKKEDTYSASINHALKLMHNVTPLVFGYDPEQSKIYNDITVYTTKPSKTVGNDVKKSIHIWSTHNIVRAAHKYSAGVDLMMSKISYAPASELRPRNIDLDDDTLVVIELDVKMQMPFGYEAWAVSRSSAFTKNNVMIRPTKIIDPLSNKTIIPIHPMSYDYSTTLLSRQSLIQIIFVCTNEDRPNSKILYFERYSENAPPPRIEVLCPSIISCKLSDEDYSYTASRDNLDNLITVSLNLRWNKHYLNKGVMAIFIPNIELEKEFYILHGLIDSDYTGDIKIMMKAKMLGAHFDSEMILGDLQVVSKNYIMNDFRSNDVRGESGFGSTTSTIVKSHGWNAICNGTEPLKVVQTENNYRVIDIPTQKRHRSYKDIEVIVISDDEDEVQMKFADFVTCLDPELSVSVVKGNSYNRYQAEEYFLNSNIIPDYSPVSLSTIDEQPLIDGRSSILPEVPVESTSEPPIMSAIAQLLEESNNRIES